MIFKMADDEKVIKGAPVNFEEEYSNIKADPLEQPLENQIQTNQNTNNQNGFERLQLLEDKLSSRAVFKENNNGELNSINIISIDFTKINYLMPYVIKVKKVFNSIMQYYVEINNKILLGLFESKYGESFKKTGIIEATKLNEPIPANINTLKEYFSDFKEIIKLNGKYSKITKNPCLTILALPFEVRPLFTEIIMDENNEINFSEEESFDFANPITLNQIIKYAEKRNELDKVAEYAKAYNNINNI